MDLPVAFFRKMVSTGAGQNNQCPRNGDQCIMFMADPGGSGMANDGHERKGKQRVQNQNNTYFIGFGILNGQGKQVRRQKVYSNPGTAGSASR